MYHFITMIEFKTKIRKWGNSLATIIPNNVVEMAKLKAGKNIRFLMPIKEITSEKRFGKLKGWKKSTEQIMKEIDSGW